MSGKQNCLLLAMDMADVGGPLSLVKVGTHPDHANSPCTSCTKMIQVPSRNSKLAF